MCSQKIRGNNTLTWSCRTVENTLRLVTRVLTPCVFVCFLPAVTWTSRRSGGTLPCITAACTKSPSAWSYSWGASRLLISVSHMSRLILSLKSSVRTYHALTVDYPSAPHSQSERRDGAGCCQATEEHSVWGGSKYWTAHLVLFGHHRGF